MSISSKSTRIHSLQHQVNSIMKKLKKSEVEDQVMTTLYNDFLILNTILNTIPEPFADELQREFRKFNSKLLEQSSDSQSDCSSQQLNLKGVALVLLKIEQKDMLLQDFLFCGGYYQSLI